MMQLLHIDISKFLYFLLLERANHHKARTKKRGNKWSISWNWMQYAEDGQKTCQSMVKFSATLHTTEVNYKIPLFSLLWLVSDKGSEAPQGWIEWGNLLDLFLVTLHKLISSPTSLFPVSLSHYAQYIIIVKTPINLVTVMKYITEVAYITISI